MPGLKSSSILTLRSARGVWVEASPEMTDGTITIQDENTVEVRVNVLPRLYGSAPQDRITTYRGSAINDIPGIRWSGDPQQVEPSTATRYEAYFSGSYEASRPFVRKAYMRKTLLSRFHRSL